MAIKLTNLQQFATDINKRSGYLYKDLALDIKQTEIVSPGFTIPVPGTDVAAAYDLAAIKNSLQNLFSTKPGERFLYPEYGLSLEEFLFSPITELNANILGSKIYNSINKWENRISVQNVDVFTDADNNRYFINIIINAPTLNLNTTIESVLDIRQQSFVILPTSQIR